MKAAQLSQEQNYRETELGFLPKDWDLRKLGDTSYLIMGQSPPGETYNKESKGTPFLQGKAEFGAIYPTHIKYTTKPLRIAKKGSVLLSVRAPVGDVNIANIEYCIGRGLASLSMDNNSFLYYLLKHFKPSIEKQGTGSTFKAINKSNLKNIIMAFPPLEEQRRISFVLSTIQATQEKNENTIKSLIELKKSLTKHLFTYGIVNFRDGENFKLKATDIGQIPYRWNLASISDLLSSPLRNGLYKPRNYFGKGIAKVIQLNNLYSSGRIIDIHSLESIDLNQKEIARYRLDENDIIINRVSKKAEGVGKASIAKLKEVKSPIVFESNMFRVKFDSDKINCDYFSFFSEDVKYIKQVAAKSLTANQTSINQSALKSILVALPTMLEQERIVSLLSSVDSRIEAEKKTKESLNELLKSMLHYLMSARIRVNHLEV